MIRSVAGVYRAAFAGLPRDVWLHSFVLLVNRSGSMVLPFISLFLTQEHGLTLAQAGRTLSLYGVGAAIGSYLGGWMSDRIGAVRTQHLSLIASGVGFVVLSTLTGTVAISVGVLVLAIVAEAFRPAVMVSVAGCATDETRVRAFALVRLAANLGVGIGPAVGGVLALYSYRWLFLADAATCWLASLLLWWTLSTASAGGRDGDEARTVRGPSPWKDVPFLLLIALVVGLAVAFFQFFSTFPLYLRREYGFREDTIGLLLALNPAIIVLFEMVLTYWAERRPRLPLVGAGCVLVCAGFGVLPFGSTVAFVALAIGIWTAGEMLALPLLNAIVAERAGPGNRGRYMGMYSGAYSIAFIVAPAIGMTVYDRFGSDVLWYSVGAMGPLMLLFALALSGPFRSGGRA